MVIRLENIGKRYGLNWIFRDLNFQFEAAKAYAVTGPNGSGKSTLLKVISGGLTPSKGSRHYNIEGLRNPDAADIATRISFAAPYISLIQELTLEEMIRFHFKFHPMLAESPEAVMEINGLAQHRHKKISQFSSGMMQRLKLSLSILSDTPTLLLDEPTSNLDVQGTEWYLELVERFTKNRLVIIGSNQKHEYSFASESLHVPDFKP